MKKVVVLSLSVLLALSFAACKKKDDKKKDENQAGMGAMQPVMAPVMAAAMTPPAMKAPVRRAPGMAAVAAAGDFKDLNVILAKQKVEIAMWTAIKTLADLKKAAASMAKLQLEIMDLQLASLKRAAALPKPKLKAYAEMAKKMQAAHAGLAKTTLADRARVMKIKGAAEFSKTEQAKYMTPALKAKIVEMMKLKKQVDAKLK